MKSIVRVAFMLGAAAILAGGMSAPSAAAGKRVVFSVDDDATCKKFFNNDPFIKQLRLKRSSGELTDGTHTDGLLTVDTDFGPNPPITLSSSSHSSSSGFPKELVKWTSTGSSPKAVNAVLVKLSSSDSAKVVFYPDAVTSDFEPIGFDKTISELSFCYGAGAGDIGYAACTLSTAALAAACPDSTDDESTKRTFFIRYDAAVLANGGNLRPELCACPNVVSEACVPDPNKQNACAETNGETLESLSTQSVLTTSGSPCRVTVCTSFFGRQICQQQTITSPAPCTP
jgi:hypothetical protein